MTRKFYPLIILALVILVFAAIPSSVRADHMGDWSYITISPLSGHWNYPGYYVLEAQRAPLSVDWEIKCSYVPCGRPEESGSHTFTYVGETILVGWGRQCYAWQFDPIGRTGFIAEAEPELCNEVTPTPTATTTEFTPTAAPTGTPVTPTATFATPTGTLTPPTPTPTGSPAVPPAATPTPTETPAAPPGTPTAPTSTAVSPGGTPTPTPEGGMTPTPAVTPDSPGPSPTQELLLPVTGELPPASPFSSPLWPSLAAVLLLGLAGRMVWTGILQSENAQIGANLYPGLRSQARKALILILVSLLILAFLVLPEIIRQVAS
jgi:hypothetical protein